MNSVYKIIDGMISLLILCKNNPLVTVDDKEKLAEIKSYLQDLRSRIKSSEEESDVEKI